MSMTRKHFEAIAEAVKLTDMHNDIKRELVSNMFANLKGFNKNFNQDTFEKACNVELSILEQKEINDIKYKG